MSKRISERLLSIVTTALGGSLTRIVGDTAFIAPIPVGGSFRLSAKGRAVSAGGGSITFDGEFFNFNDMLGLVVSPAQWAGGGAWSLDLAVTVQLKAGVAYQPADPSAAYSVNAIGTFTAPDGTVLSVGTGPQDVGQKFPNETIAFLLRAQSSAGSGDAIEVDDFAIELA